MHIQEVIMKNFTSIRIIIVFLFTIVSQAQVGINTPTPQGALDITSSNDGLLIPRVALTITTSALPLTSPTISELVYNSATVADVTPGFYYWNGTIWVRLATGASNDWSIIGNTGIVDGTNFIGTAAGTNVDVAFRRNNLAAGKIGATSTSFGLGALTAGATSNSTAFGTNALLLNTGDNNVAIGNGTLATNITGIQNTGIGNSALTLNTGNANSALGFEALFTNSSGNNNTGVGFEAMRGNTTGSNNTGIGFQASRNNLIGSNNTALGFQALNDNRANFNTAVGTQASALLNSGASNTSVGYQAHGNATTGSQNVAIGERSLGRNNGSANTVIGWEAMFGATSTASNSTAVGWHSLFNNSGANNTAIGYNASQGNSTATENTAIGAGSLNDNSTGSRNTAVGRNAGFATTSNDGTFVGFNAGAFSTGTQNAVLGAYALDASGASARNVAIGYNALTNTTSGVNNTAIGHSALSSLATGSGNVAIGYQAGFTETTSNKLYISNSNTTPTTSLIYGEFAPTRILRTNSTFQIGDPTGTGYVFPIARGANNEILQTDASGVLSWNSKTVKPYLTTGALAGVYIIPLTEYTVRVFNSVSEVRLPSAVGNIGKIFIVIGSNTISAKIFSTAGGVIYDDVSNTFINTLNPNERYMVQSDGTDWIVIGR
ncbi:hypothetical protein GCM10022389_03370 [Flavobacterium cheonanense]|uniref:Trimeric autotransporter adhesin YadA-like head domain-containing protein n=2 Tax=Flavobacterium cheonanense TaxID=706183 RepID=A0ABP7VAD2_9FLAO